MSLRFVADSVPAMGYRLYKIERTKAASETKSELRIGKGFVQNRWYSVEFDRGRGCLTGIQEMDSGRQLIDSRSRFRMNELVGRDVETGKLARMGPMQISVTQRGPVSASIRLTGSARGIHGIDLANGLQALARQMDCRVMFPLDSVSMRSLMIASASTKREVLTESPSMVTKLSSIIRSTLPRLSASLTSSTVAVSTSILTFPVKPRPSK